ncbi:MAG: hypothetical protein NTX86_00135, partial [Candidatus Dependentiae bacterium]|nr:hypothetical protein [Candidatus Dependentiae bacterium]
MITKPTSRTINSSDNAYPLNAISEINTPRSRTNPLVTEDKNKAPGLMHEPYKSPARINSKAQEKKDKKPIEIEP